MHSADDRDFDDLSWHDDPIYGLSLRLGDPHANDWRSDLVLDIDHIVEWVRSAESFRFRVAPATLIFHGTTDLRIDIDWGMRGSQVAPWLPSIGHIEREPVRDQKVHLDRCYYMWRIVLNAPPGASIAFGAVGFDMTLRSEPILCDEQHVPASLRAATHP